MLAKITLLVRDISELVTVASKNKPLCGSKMSTLGIIKNGAVAVDKNKIIEAGSSKKLSKKYRAKHVIHAAGKTVTPGLVDPHTHPVFSGDRSREFEMRLQGATYQQISKAGGGIKSTVKEVRKASHKYLRKKALFHLKQFLAHGTTTIEAKSGYGLNLKDEVKMLEVIRSLNKSQPIELIPTFLGAHEIPPEYKHAKYKYINLLKKKIIPVIAKHKLAEFCDVFCEKNVYSIKDSREILLAAKNHGLKLKLHADEFAPTNGAVLAAQLNAVSADHLMAISNNGIRQMKKKKVVAVLLPGTTFTLGLKKYAPARKIINAGIPVALATDFNPGTCFTESLPIIMAIACSQMKMTPAEVLVATTINAACAIDKHLLIGSLEAGKQADLVIWNTPSYTHIPYHFGINLAEKIIKRGRVYC